MTNASPLNYSRNTGADWRKLLLRIVGALVLCAIFAGSLVLACDRFHYWDRDGFRDALESVPGVRVRGIDGFDDGPVWKVVGACVVVGDGGGREIYLRFAEPADLRHGRSLPVSG